MKTLFIVTLLTALAVVALCYESHESMESWEMNPFINRRRANNFMAPQDRWRLKIQERTRERTKPTYEIQREACDDYALCSRYAFIHGYNAAYNRYFRQHRNN
ncbi:matrix Gla protein [Phascolarctos cinereus]|uniref:Matrix Gla protein n=1 Tax=Phascolarctos cinereus TaxID=38626 RepID=A0A6P5KZL2_PHACI|nr:matrix Gla protein [Phascolarctos cinereus]